MFNFFKEKVNNKEQPINKDSYFEKIDLAIHKEQTPDKLVNELSLIISEIDNKIANENFERAEKIFRYLLINFFLHVSNVGMIDISFESFLNNNSQKYFQFISDNPFSEEAKKGIFKAFISEFVSDDYFFSDFMNKLVENIYLDMNVVENILHVKLIEIIEQQAASYLSDKQYSYMKSERGRIVDMLLDLYKTNKDETKYIELASHELHDNEDYIRLIDFLILKNKVEEAVIYCYQAIDKDIDNQGIYFEKLSEIYESQNEFEKAFAFKVKSLYLKNNKEAYLKIKQVYDKYPEAKEYNAKIINSLREHKQFNLLIEIFLEEHRYEDALEIASLPEIKIEEKLWVIEYTKKEFPEETLSLYKEILSFYTKNIEDVNYQQMIINCMREIKKLYIDLDRIDDYKSYEESFKTLLPHNIVKEIVTNV